MSKSNYPRYEDRVVLFLDFLGFREIIKGTVADEATISNVIGAIDRLRDIGRQKEFFESQEVTQFSDSVVVSYRCDERSAAFDMVSEIAFALVDLVERGFLVRGGASIGKVVHSSKYLFGPAMIEAYELESKCASYPRVIVSEKLFDVARRAPAIHHDGDDESGYVAAYLAKDTDGWQYIDYISWNAVVDVIGGDEDGYGDYLACIARILKAGASATSLDVRTKYGWLHERYNGAVKKITSLKSDDPWVRANPDIYQQILDLPSKFWT